MVWAKTKLMIWDYIFEPAKEIKINFSGKNPEKFYKKLNELIRIIFNVPEGYIQEKDYNWENLKDTQRFEIAWEINKLLDTFSYIAVELDLRGFSTNGEGKVTIRIKPRMITEYPQDTIWQQNIIYEMLRRFWHKAYYHHRRMEYLAMGRDMLINFERAIKEYAETLK
ncbi:MAG: hypothetical protein V1900_04300 [Candidatus Aenigmatarchaeota archaeon]